MENSTTNFVNQYEPGKQTRVELKNGRILDVINGCYFDSGTSIILQNGKIESLPGRATGLRIPVDFTIDLKGKTLLPSLFNTHFHMAMAGATTMVFSLSDMWRSTKYREQQKAKNMAECLAHGITHVRDAWEADLHDNRALKERISKGEIPGPRILQAVAVGLPGSYLQEKPSLKSKFLMPTADPAKDYGGSVTFPVNANEQQVRDAVDRAIDERGAEAIKIGEETASINTGKPIPIMSNEQLCAVADQARRRGVQSLMHHSSIESFRRGVKAGVSSLEHEPWDALLTRADVNAFKAAGCISDPTISVFYSMWSWKVARDPSNGSSELDRLTEFRDKTYTFATIADEYFIPEMKVGVLNGYKRCANGKPKMMGIIDVIGMLAWNPKTANAFENIHLLYEHGASMTTGNDTMPPCTPAMMSLELLMFDHILKGKPDGKQLSGAEAVRIATINSARCLGLEKEFGSIESGKTADLVILNGNPLEDINAMDSVLYVVKDGELVLSPQQGAK